MQTLILKFPMNVFSMLFTVLISKVISCSMPITVLECHMGIHI